MRHEIALFASLLALGTATLAASLDARVPCRWEAGCMDERGPFHPVVPVYLAAAGSGAAALGLALRSRVRGAWFAGLLFWPAALAALGAVLAATGRGVDLLWPWAVTAMGLGVAFVALASARRGA